MKVLNSVGTGEALATSLGVCVFAITGIIFTSWKLSRGRRTQAVVLSAADRRIQDAPVEQDGATLHRQVPMERWCVTRDDLRQFRRLVQNAIQEGRILPTDRDPFDPKDDTIGPCIHTVNTQFIVPVTAAAGGASWALMKHPEGLPCDLFVTHCWAEGIYEFVDKVLHSWPSQARNAYCCMLSNPQTLDISGLIAAPMESPFAKALRNARYMLVVPNKKGSIYTRVWCAYEAFLGYSWGKIITTASSPKPGYWISLIRCDFVVLLGAGAGGILLVATPLDVRAIHWVTMTGIGLLGVVWWCLRWRASSPLVRFLEFGGQFNVGVLGGATLLDLPLHKPIGILGCMIGCAVFIAVPHAFESDRLELVEAAEEQRELERGFTGRLRDAQCSVATDGERIRQELTESGNEAAVDKAVHVLICMGMFSSLLRRVVDRAGVLGDVNRWSRVYLVFCLAAQALFPLEAAIYGTCELAWLRSLAWAELALYFGLFAWQAPDRQAFVVGLSFLVLPVTVIWVGENAVEGRSCIAMFTLALGINPLLIVLTALGPLGVARVPLVGPVVIRTILGPKPYEEPHDDPPVVGTT